MRFFKVFLSVFLTLAVVPARALDPRLAALNDWLYVLSRLLPGTIDDLAATSFDLLVLDYALDGEPPASLRRRRSPGSRRAARRSSLPVDR